MSGNETNYRPAPILLHAYRSVTSAYQGHISINTYDRKPAASGDNKEFVKAAQKTIENIQIAYTQGRLNKEMIATFINIHLPQNLQPSADGLAFTASYQVPEKLSDKQREMLAKIMEETNHQTADSCSFAGKNEILIHTANAKNFSAISQIITTALSAIEARKTYTDKQVTQLVREAYGEDYANLNARFRKRIENRSNSAKNQDRVITHSVSMLEEIEGTDLTPLAAHLMRLGKNDEYPFSALEAYHSYAKATKDENGIPSIRLLLPVFEKEDPARDKKLSALIRRVIKDTAQAFNEENEQEITTAFVASLIDYSWDKRKSAFNAEAHRSYVTDEILNELTDESVYGAIRDWLPMSFDNIAQNLGIEMENVDHVSKIRMMLGRLVDGGQLTKAGSKYNLPQPFKAKNVKMMVTARDHEGNIYASPVEWDQERYGTKPEVVFNEQQQGDQKIGLHDAIRAELTYYMGSVEHAKITKVETYFDPVTNDHDFSADEDEEDAKPSAKNLTVSKDSIKPEDAAKVTGSNNIYISQNAAVPADGTIAGIVQEGKDNTWYFKPSLAGIGRFAISAEDTELKAGDILTVKIKPESRAFEHIIGIHGNLYEEAGHSKLSAVEQGIPLEFPEDILDGTPPLIVPPPSKDRVDFRDVPCITIDPPTAKDFDDAIYVEENSDGWKVMVFIADVTHYMKPDTKLFEEAYKRGNSTYLPDLTIPMLPEALSNDICSLRPEEDRACLVTTMQINKDGQITKKHFDRGLMRSRARFHYDEVQDALEGNLNEQTAKFYKSHIQPAFDVFKALSEARERRGGLNFNTPEQRIDITDGEETFTLELQNESHGIIEELMISSNIAAIETLLEKNSLVIARVHGLPNERTLKEFTTQLAEYGVTLPDENLAIEQRVEQILQQAEGSPHEDDIKRLMVRCQDKAKYRAELSEHYALKLDAYTHETSPIRRMTDWYIHALLNEACNLKEGSKLTPDMKRQIGEAAEHFSETERRSAEAERQTKLRLAASWVEKRLGDEFNAAVTHVTAKGVFIKVAGGSSERHEIKSFIPTQDLDRSASNDPNSEAYYKPGKAVTVRAVEADPVTAIIKFQIVQPS